MSEIKRVLVSVSDKTGLLEFIMGLKELIDVEVISTGGTAKFLKDAGLNVTMLSDLTGVREFLGGRVKTLHPNVHGGILARRDNKSDIDDLKSLGIKTIDMVVVNLYPFVEVVKNKDTKLDDAIENIDIGGVALIRAAAKNYKNVVVVSSPYVYQELLDHIRQNGNKVDEFFRQKLSAMAFCMTTQYDGAISNFLKNKFKIKDDSIVNKEQINLTYFKIQDLRYGENPHQKAAFFKDASKIDSYGAAGVKCLWGKELSYNNIIDIDSACEIVSAFDKPAACIIKHTNPCGVAVSNDINKAFLSAHKCDPLSAFGGIVGLNAKVDDKTAKSILGAGFLECVVATGYEKSALNMLKQRKNMRILVFKNGDYKKGMFDIRQVRGGLLVQEHDSLDVKISDVRVVTKKKPSKVELDTLLFAWKVAKFVKSNAIVFAKENRTISIGAGQTSRVDSVVIAKLKAGKNSKGCVLASDGFFPKEDNILEAKKAGIGAIIQPGGSIKDDDVIKACDKAGISMVFTGCRHFKH